MITKAQGIINSLTEMGWSPVNCDLMKERLIARIEALGVKGIMVDDVSADNDGNIIVDFSDTEDNMMSVSFSYEDDGAKAMILDKGNDTIVVDLGGLTPSVLSTSIGAYLNLLELSWLNKSTLLTILSAGELAQEDNEKASQSLGYDAFGNITQPVESHVSRSGKKVRLPIVSSLNNTKLSLRQKIAKSRPIRDSVKKRSKFLKPKK